MSTPYPESRLRGLRPWKPGQSGNSQRNGGRKKGLVTLIREVLEGNELGGLKTPDGRSIAEHYAEAIIAHGMKGNSPYMVQVMERLEGKISTEPVVDEEARKAQNPVVILPAKEMHGADIQAPAGTADSIPGK